jgi:phosphoserine phosphatase
MAERALRVLASAYRDVPDLPPAELTVEGVEHDLVFVGMAGMQDPPRPEAKAAVDQCRAAGIRVVMITGDHPQTATAIARELGIISTAGKAVTGRELDTLDEATLRRRVSDIAVYARVSPEHKLRIIRAWKAGNAVVAMTGDGVNDAPALKGADIGIAMGKTGTEVTRQAADMIITDDNFARNRHWEALLDRLPLARQPGFAPTVIFSALEAHTRIPPHTGSTNARLLVHLPLILPGPARFRVGNETRSWRMGEAWAFDDSIDHEAWNDADALRVIMILDIWNPLLTEDEREAVTALMNARNAFFSA